jgi:hypothetical protein
MSKTAAQTLEDLACAYWLSDALFAAIELRLFGFLGIDTKTLPELARAADCLEEPLLRLLTALAELRLVAVDEDRWHNLPLACRHLIPGTPEYLGDFLLYRRYLQKPWQGLAATVAGRPLPPGLSRHDDYPSRNLHYVRALDQLARLKAQEIACLLAEIPWHGPILDIGGGAGALSRALVKHQVSRSLPPQQATQATLFELPEVLAAARTLYPDPNDWQDISTQAGDFRSNTLDGNQRFGLVLMSNFLHTYDEVTAHQCLKQALALLAKNGHLLIHDYCPDRTPVKGQLYDLNMMLNTHQGRCFTAHTLCDWLTACGMSDPRIIDLPSDSSLILAQAQPC